MTAVETIVVGKQKHEIPVKPITMLFHAADMLEDIKYPDRMVITPEGAVEHIEWCKVWHTDTQKCVAAIFKDDPSRFTPETIKEMGHGAKTAAGFVDIGLKLRDMKVKFVFRHPEAGLHPSSQAEMMQFIIDHLFAPTG